MCTHKITKPRNMGRLQVLIIVALIAIERVQGMPQAEKNQLRSKVMEMFNFAYHNYMEYAYPADELMPLSCKGRYRGTQRSRGDIDDILGNFSLSLVDTLDTLVVLGMDEEFEKAARLVADEVSFDNDIVVSVFETNIRMLGGLLGGHVMAMFLKDKGRGMLWYRDELLEKAKDLGYRLLPAFNTTTGIPYPRVNLRHGIKDKLARTGHEKDTCTACAGTMILEFAALSRLTGITIFEEKARQAMDVLWRQRHRTSDLVGTVINIHNGDWVRRESGVGAGIDSYYEYLLKAYILLGDDSYLERFNRHYDAIMKYVSQGPMMVDVHMHRPLTNSRNFMDALLAFWPGLQVLKGDIKPAIEIHEMLYQVTQQHNFLPEAFTTDFRVHWGQHPLRPEFVESTYFLYKATSDPYYLEVGKSVVNNLDSHARVKCGFAAIKDVTSGAHHDQMDSYVLAETFKYLYLLFTDAENLTLDIDNYIFTTEAHLLPLTLSVHSPHFPYNNTKPSVPDVLVEDDRYEKSCPNTHHMFPDGVHFAHNIRMPLKDLVSSVCPSPKPRKKPRLQATHFIAGDRDQHVQLHRMGIKIITMADGRVQLLHTAADASSPEDAEEGMLFMQEMIELSKTQQQEVTYDPRVIQLLDPPHFGSEVLNAGPAQFGYDLRNNPGVQGKMLLAHPYKGCDTIHNDVNGKFALVERGSCMFIDKARHLQAAGAIGGIVIDHNLDSGSRSSPLFSMSGDGTDDITIPMLFVFREEGNKLLEALKNNPDVEAYVGFQAKPASTNTARDKDSHDFEVDNDDIVTVEMKISVPGEYDLGNDLDYKQLTESDAHEHTDSAHDTESGLEHHFAHDPVDAVESYLEDGIKAEGQSDFYHESSDPDLHEMHHDPRHDFEPQSNHKIKHDINKDIKQKFDDITDPESKLVNDINNEFHYETNKIIDADHFIETEQEFAPDVDQGTDLGINEFQYNQIDTDPFIDIQQDFPYASQKEPDSAHLPDTDHQDHHHEIAHDAHLTVDSPLHDLDLDYETEASHESAHDLYLETEPHSDPEMGPRDQFLLQGILFTAEDLVMKDLMAKRANQGDQSQTGTDSSDQLASASQTNSHSDVDSPEKEANILLDHYLHKIDLGHVKVNLNSDLPLMPGSESLLKIIEGPNNSKQVTLQMEDIVTGDVDKMIEKITSELFKLLYSQTNFKTVKEQNDYLNAVSEIIQAAVLQDENKIKSSAGPAFDRLGIDVRPSSKEPESESSIDIEVTEEGHAIAGGNKIFVYTKGDGSMTEFTSDDMTHPDTFTLTKKGVPDQVVEQPLEEEKEEEEEEVEDKGASPINYMHAMDNFFAHQEALDEPTVPALPEPVVPYVNTRQSSNDDIITMHAQKVEEPHSSDNVQLPGADSFNCHGDDHSVLSADSCQGDSHGTAETETGDGTCRTINVHLQTNLAKEDLPSGDSIVSDGDVSVHEPDVLIDGDHDRRPSSAEEESSSTALEGPEVHETHLLELEPEAMDEEGHVKSTEKAKFDMKENEEL